jgi:dTDP-3-amino-3,4,6-trideoxy-alpha-D-glucose transaminase
MNDFRGLWSVVREDALRAVDRVGESGWLILGSEVQAFEEALAVYWGIPHVVGCGNGLDAIEISLRCLGIQTGDVVLTTPLSAFATTLAIIRAGGVPWFVDVDESGLIDLDEVERVLGSHPEIRWLIPVHLYGHAVDLSRLERLRARFGVHIVEDCAQGVGARTHGEPIGTVGAIAATTIYPTKNLGCFGDGGAILTRDPALAASARSLRDYGQSSKYEHARLGLNSRLDELQAALMRDAILPRLRAMTERRVEIARRYRDEIRNPALRLPTPPFGSSSVWHLFPVLVEGDVKPFIDHLSTRGIATARHYPRLIPDQPALQARTDVRAVGDLETARGFAANEVSLPIHPLLTDEDVGRVIVGCREYRS